MPVVFVVLDAFPNSAVDVELTPTIDRLARSGARHPDGGRAELTAATYPNHATFATGVSTLEHRIIANRVLVDGRWRPAAEVGPAAPTIFEACRTEGRSSALVVGDQYLVGTCGGGAADEHWPPGGDVPEGAARSDAGYVADRQVVDVLAGLELGDFDLLFVQLDEVDGARHRYGAWSDEAAEQCHRTDAALGTVVEMLQPRWDDTVLMVVGDHDQEDIDASTLVDFESCLPDGVDRFYQGTAVLLVGPMGRADLLDLPGVIDATSLDSRHHVVWGRPGQVFGWGHGESADHGSPRTATQLAVVSGGHPDVARLRSEFTAARPPATVWARWMAETLGLTWRPKNGQDVNRVSP